VSGRRSDISCLGETQGSAFRRPTPSRAEMTISAITRQRPLREPFAQPYLWVFVGIGAGAALGGMASASSTGAIVLAPAIAFLIWVVRRPPVILIALIASIFAQVVTVGGLTIGRLLAPIALLIVTIALLRGATLRFDAPLRWVTAYALWALASALWSPHLGSTLTQLASLGIGLSYMLAFAVFVGERRAMNGVLYTLAIVAFGVGIYGMVSSQGRAGTETGDANYFAMVEIVALPLVLTLAADTRARWLRLGGYGVVLVIIAAVFSSLSRGGLIALGAVLVFIVFVPARTFFHSPAQKAIVVLCLIVGVVGAYKMTSQALSQRVEAIFTAQGRTGSGRLNAWRAADTSFRERPYFGLGYGAFEPSANDLMLQTPGVDLSNFLLRRNGLEAHSAYIGTLAELGIPGLALFLGMLGSTAIAIRRAAARARKLGAISSMRIANALLISLVGWAVASIFLSSETSRPLWIMIGMAVALPKLTAQESGTTEPEAAG
jgi:putative inorganic carbon (hco3(-)) transporter